LELFTFPVKLEKSEKKGNRIDVRVIASDESLDREKDQVLSKAFTSGVREYFLKYGVIDYDHLTIRGKNAIEKSTAIIGTPTRFYEETIGGMPVQVIEAFLHVGNPYVDNMIAPALLSGSDRIGASVGGKITSFSNNQHGGRSVDGILMNHLAITPTYRAINPNSRVEPIGVSKVNIEKSEDYDTYCFESVGSFCKSLEAGVETDSLAITGGQALQSEQQIEPKKIISVMINKNLPVTREEVVKVFKLFGYPYNEEILSKILSSSETIRKAQKWFHRN